MRWTKVQDTTILVILKYGFGYPVTFNSHHDQCHIFLTEKNQIPQFNLKLREPQQLTISYRYTLVEVRMRGLGLGEGLGRGG